MIKINSLVLSLLIASGCDHRNDFSGADEAAYQEYVSTLKSIDPLRAQRMNNTEEIQNIYQESGLNDLMLGINSEGNKLAVINSVTIEDFYQSVVKKYANNDLLEPLKTKTIWFAVTKLELLEKKDKASTDLLVKYTRELMSNTHHSDFQLSYDCLAQIKGLIPNTEYNNMIRQQRFAIRFLSSDIDVALAKAEKNPEAINKVMLKSLQEQAESMSTLDRNFADLFIKDKDY